ncbi:MAG: hypothetical protein ACOYI5_07910 [Christensenellales bacterium]|jgi:hypothetical protein
MRVQAKRNSILRRYIDKYHLNADTFDVYAILKRKRLFGESCYFLLCSEHNIVYWNNARLYKIVDTSIPNHWVTVKNRANMIVYTLDGVDPLKYSYYSGPRLLIDHIENLAEISYVDAGLSKRIISDAELT